MFSEQEAVISTDTTIHQADESEVQAPQSESVVNIGSVHVIGDSASQKNLWWDVVNAGTGKWYKFLYILMS